MASLAKCLDQITDLSQIEKDAILDSHGIYLKEGEKPKDARIKAVQDALSDIDKEELDIVKQIREVSPELADSLLPPEKPKSAPESTKEKPVQETVPEQERTEAVSGREEIIEKNKLPQFKTYDEAQKAIDDYETKLMDEGKTDAEMDKDPFLNQLYDARDNKGQGELEQSASEISSVINKVTDDNVLTDNILKNIYNVDPKSKTGQYFAAEYTQKQVKERKDTREKIFNAIKEDYGKKNNLDMDGIFSEMSGLTRKGQEKLLKELTDKAAQIETIVYEYFNGKQPTPTEEAKGKEPWEMTRDEFAQIGVDRNYLKKDGKYYTLIEGEETEVPTQEINRMKNEVFVGSHKQRVAEALSEGKPVPEEVINDYPDLKEKYTRKEDGTWTETKKAAKAEEAEKVVNLNEMSDSEINKYLRDNVDMATIKRITGEDELDFGEGIGDVNAKSVFPINGRLFVVDALDEYARRQKLREVSLEDVNPPQNYLTGSKEVRNPNAVTPSSATTIVKSATENDIKRFRKDLSKYLTNIKAEKAGEESKIIVYPGDYIKFKTTGGTDNTGDVSSVQDGEVYVIPDGGKTPVKIGGVTGIIRKGTLHDRAIKEEKSKPTEGKEKIDLNISEYSPKSVVVRGDTKTYKDDLKKLGGRFNPRLQGGSGWIFPKTKQNDVQQFIDSGEVKISQQKTDSKIEVSNRDETIRKRNAAKLRKVAEKTKASGEDKYSQDRNTNTARRARMAASAQADAAAQIAIAETMFKIADAIESGDVKYLNKVSAMTQVRMLDTILNQANYRYLKEKYPEYSDYQKHKDDKITIDAVDNVEYPKIRINSGLIPGLKQTLSGQHGGRKIADKIYGEYLSNDLAKEILDFAKKKGITKDLPWTIESDYKEITSLNRLELTSEGKLKNALKELINLRASKRQEDPIKAMERELIGVKLPGFFPTPKTIIDRMVDEADIREGMDVLEPSAGKGDIADAVRETGIEPDTIEISQTLRRFLDAKNHNVVSSDFMEFDNKQYDRIIMNPPFENLQDIDHVKHAYDLLKPGGRIVSIMGEGAFFRNDKKAREFREWLENHGGISEQLPQGSFKGSEAFRQTGVASRIVVIDKPGESYAIAGATAETASSEGLRQAMSLDAKGSDVKEIWQKTGWMKGVEGRWKFEIDDSKAKVRDVFESMPETRLFSPDKSMRLEEILDHPELFKAYPSLKGLLVKKQAPLFDLLKTHQGWFDENKNIITVTPYARNVKETLLHELQHWIQAREGFARGGNLNDAIDAVDKKGIVRYAKKTIESLNEQIKNIQKSIASNDKYKALLERIPTQNRKAVENLIKELTDTRNLETKEFTAFKKENPDTNFFTTARSKELRKSIDGIRRQINNLIKANSRYDYAHISVYAKNGISNGIREIEKENFEKRNSILNIKNDISKLNTTNDLNELKETIKKLGKASFDIYQSLAGEIEAREVANRRNLTKEQRRLMLPHVGETIPRSEWIIKTGKGTSFSVEGATPEAINQSPLKPVQITRQVLKQGLPANTKLKEQPEGFIATLPGGKQVWIYTNTGLIAIKPEAMRKEYGRDPTETEKAIASWTQIDGQGIMFLSGYTDSRSIPELVRHEVFHAGEETLTPAQLRGLRKDYKTSAEAADAYAEWDGESRIKGYSVFQKIRRFFRRIANTLFPNIFDPTSGQVFADIRSGKVFEQQVKGDGTTSTKYQVDSSKDNINILGHKILKSPTLGLIKDDKGMYSENLNGQFFGYEYDPTTKGWGVYDKDGLIETYDKLYKARSLARKIAKGEINAQNLRPLEKVSFFDDISFKDNSLTGDITQTIPKNATPEQAADKYNLVYEGKQEHKSINLTAYNFHTKDGYSFTVSDMKDIPKRLADIETEKSNVSYAIADDKDINQAKESLREGPKLEDDIQNSKNILRQAQGFLGKRFGKGFEDRDIKLFNRAFSLPYWLAKRYDSMNKLVGNEIDASEKRSTELFKDYNETELGRIQSEIPKNKAVYKELKDTVWKYENKRFPKKDVPTNWHKEIKKGEDIEINPEHYIEVDNYLKKQGVSDKAREAFIEIRKILDSKYVDIDKTLRVEKLDPTLIEEYRSQIGKVNNYFPHRRTGDAYVQITKIDEEDPENRTVYREHYNSFNRLKNSGEQVKDRARKWLDDAIKSGEVQGTPEDFNIKIGKVKQLPDEIFFNIPVEAMQQILNVAGTSLSDARVKYEAQRLYNAEGKTEKEALELARKRLTADMEKALSQAVSDVLKSRGFGRHALLRKGIPGHETDDVFGILFDYLSGYAGFKTKIERSRKHSKVLFDINARENPGEYKYASKYVKDVLANQDRVDRVVDGLRSIFYVKYLGFVPKSALVNLTQNVVLAAPTLSAYIKKGGIFKAERLIGRAMKDTRRALTSKEAWTQTGEIKYPGLTEDEQKALHEMVESGASMDLFLRELQGNLPELGWSKYFNKVVKKAGLFMQIAEKWNRASTGLAAYRLAYNQGVNDSRFTNTKGNHEASLKFAKQVIYDSHFLYGKSNLPELMRGGDIQKVLRSGYTFRTFTHNYVSAMAHLFANQPGGKKAFARSLRNLFLVGGLTAVPFFKALSEALLWATGDDDEDAATRVRDVLPNQWLRDIVTYGLPGALGVDLTGSLSIEVPKSWKDLIGVPYALIEDSANTIESLKSGAKWRALSETPFTPLSVRNAMRGIELYHTGQRSRSGKDINYPGEAGARKITGTEAIGKSLLGLQPTSVSKGYGAYQASKRIQESLQKRKSKFADRYVNALKSKNDDARKDVIEDLQEWNRKARDEKKPYLIIDIRSAVEYRLRPNIKSIPKNLRQKVNELSNTWK